MGKKGLIATSGVLWAIAVGFILMFKKVSDKYTDRVCSLEGEKFPIYRFMSAKGYLLIGIMMSMGIGLLSGSLRFFSRALAVRFEV